MSSKSHISRVIPVLVSILMLTVQLSAQEQIDLSGWSKLRIGVKGGGSISAFSSNIRLNSDWGYGYQVGATISYSVLSWLRVSFEPVYSNISSKIKPSVLYNIYNPNDPIIKDITLSKVNFSCAELPILAKLEIPDYKGKYRPVLSIGGSSGIYLNAVSNNTLNYIVGTVPTVAKVSDNVTNMFKYYDFAAVIGAGIEKGNASIEFFYRFALKTLNTVHSSSFQDFGVNSLQINFGYKF